MRYRIAEVTHDRAIMTLDGSLSLAKGDVVLVAVVDSIDEATEAMVEIERRKRERK